VRIALERGLSRDAAIRALTLDAATMAGAGSRLGSIEPGKRANLLVTEGDVLDAKSKIKHVFVGGRLIAVQP
jgi:imidazolonepropionase-like amidohydrolase